ncbi:hypothetical protein VP1G_00965 [Cytospora mali]|uniref:Mutanase n=1 Tax=Cytospora mali TaxID=578113 RepID=A0A194UPM8_CYTMA|nr:hypothetical protein VP1G_00965 [Valsa mali var. pyri (nom. inval.)]
MLTAYDADFQRAKALGIDAFALNIGTDFYTDTQLGYAYASAAANDMKVFISFDFNWWSTSEGTAVGQKIAQYASLDAQLKVDNKVFASSFAGDGIDVSAIRTAAGVDLYWAPNFHPSYGTNFSTIDGALNWMAWPNNGNNKAPTAGANVTVEEGDAEYIAALGTADRYIAPVSAWFSTHYGPEVSYSKNWVFPGDLLWYDRWNEILSLGPRFVEIVTWNDYGESHYIGPLDSPHYDDGNSKWTNDMPHDGWMDIAKPFISAFKDGVSSANSYVTTDELVYWYRPTLKSIDCDATDTTMVAANNDSGNYFEGRPNGYESLSDSVFVVSLLTSAGIITVESGSTIQEFYAPQGISAYEVPMDVGKQQFFLSRNGQTTMSAVSLKNISDICPCGIYNFNAYVGTVPESAPDQLQPDGLNSLTAGLHVTTCLATPSLGTVAITPTSTPAITVSSGATSPGAGPYDEQHKDTINDVHLREMIRKKEVQIDIHYLTFDQGGLEHTVSCNMYRDLVQFYEECDLGFTTVEFDITDEEAVQTDLFGLFGTESIALIPVDDTIRMNKLFAAQAKFNPITRWKDKGRTGINGFPANPRPKSATEYTDGWKKRGDELAEAAGRNFARDLAREDVGSDCSHAEIVRIRPGGLGEPEDHIAELSAETTKFRPVIIVHRCGLWVVP